jgi:hypothetical protein
MQLYHDIYTTFIRDPEHSVQEVVLFVVGEVLSAEGLCMS